ncbi:MAG: hypothetical protein V4754_21665 [Pseudomonadota bacterium]
MSFVALSILSMVFLVLFVGVDRFVGDHEVGVTWIFFLKHKPTVQFEFSNPAQLGLELIPINKLTPGQRKKVIEYCDIRYGIVDIDFCYSRSPLGKP